VHLFDETIQLHIVPIEIDLGIFEDAHGHTQISGRFQGMTDAGRPVSKPEGWPFALRVKLYRGIERPPV